ncbi:hypothetical protein HK103_003860 [Boothiomyces macroporosus]|uniref:RNB domain-containing protein n=1 Tax=Boothiomyces macroporosus TaxID=261099 RepID=A0AAD5Y8I0_9FUNG|nr:hypothetical protein HK103_003860 [Boothiomyces macroporosus]
MDKIKEKLEKLRIESDANLARAEKAETEVKALKETISKQESSIQTLNNKVSLLAGDLERAEKRADEHKQKKAESENSDAVKENLERKIQLLEKQLDDKERDRKEATEKSRELSIVAEKHERKAKQLEAEKSDLERQLADSAAKYATVKAELDQTLKDLEGLIEQLSAENPHISFYKVNVDAATDISECNQVRAMPTFSFYDKGKKTHDVVGADIKKIKLKTAVLGIVIKSPTPTNSGYLSLTSFGHLTEHSLDNVTFSNPKWAYSLDNLDDYRIPPGMTDSTRELLEKYGIPLHITKHLQEFQRCSLQYKTEIEATEKEMYDSLPGDVDLAKAAQFMFKVQSPTPAEKLAINEILMKGTHYQVKLSNEKSNPLFIKRSLEQVQFIESCLDAMQSRDNRNSKLINFLSKIKPVIIATRSGQLLKVDWSDDDLDFINFIKDYLRIGPNQPAVETKIITVGILKKLGLYSFYPSQQDAIKLLKEIGVFTPHEDLSLYQYNPKGYLGHLEYLSSVGDIATQEAKDEAALLVNSGSYVYENSASRKSSPTSLESKPLSANQEVQEYVKKVVHSSLPLENYPTSDPTEKLRQVVSEPVYTIDEPTAHELDDGISLEETETGSWLHVHIADPTAYILPGNKLANLAQIRGTSIYLPHIHFPMMPDVLSNELFNLGKSPCALTLSAKIGEDGEILDYKITPSILENVKITHYSSVDRALENGSESTLDNTDISRLKKMHELISKHRKSRIRNGAFIPDQIDLSIKVDEEPLTISLRDPRTNFSTPGHFEKNTITVKTSSSVRSLSHQLVSESMIIAGRVASKFCQDRRVTTAYRHQPDIVDNLDEHGYHSLIPTVEKILDNVRSSIDPDTGIIPIAVYEPLLSYMPPAKMIMKPLGHFSMGINGDFNGYVKSTSPLRRYQDMLVHWQIKASLLNEKQPFSDSQIVEITERMNEITGSVKSLNKRSNRYWLLEHIRRLCFNNSVDNKSVSVLGRNSLEPYVNDGSGPRFKGVVVANLGNGNVLVNLPEFGNFRSRCLVDQQPPINSEITVQVEKVIPDIGCTALGFQIMVLYPWHNQLDADFHELKQFHAQKLADYHQKKLMKLEEIETLLQEGKKKK